MRAFAPNSMINTSVFPRKLGFPVNLGFRERVSEVSFASTKSDGSGGSDLLLSDWIARQYEGELKIAAALLSVPTTKDCKLRLVLGPVKADHAKLLIEHGVGNNNDQFSGCLWQGGAFVAYHSKDRLITIDGSSTLLGPLELSILPLVVDSLRSRHKALTSGNESSLMFSHGAFYQRHIDRIDRSQPPSGKVFTF